MLTSTAVQTQLCAHLPVGLGPCVLVRGLAGDSGVVVEMDSFLNRVLPSPCGVGTGWGGPPLLPLGLQGCPPPHVGQDVQLDSVDGGAVVPAHDGHTVGPHQELLKVPANVMDLHGLPEELV